MNLQLLLMLINSNILSVFLSIFLVVRRARSFTDKSLFSVRRSISPDFGINGSTHSIASQECYAINRPVNHLPKDDSSPPPVPPRAPRRPHSLGIDQTDPPYSYIKDDIDSGKVGSGAEESVDQQLEDLLRDIMEDNKSKKRRQTFSQSSQISPYAESANRKTQTLGSHTQSMEEFDRKKKEFVELYGDRPASDYLEPVPSKTAKEKIVGHTHGSTQQQHKDWRTINGAFAKRNSSSGEFFIPVSSKSNHDYHTIPDKPVPQHSHTSSTDSTHTPYRVESERRSWARSQSGSDGPPSPPLPPRPSHFPKTYVPPTSPTKMSFFVNKKDDISPYAIAKGIVLPSEDSPAPPLPPRSPNRYHRERVSLPSQSSSSSVGYNQHRCPKCNGLKISKSTARNDNHHHAHHHHHQPHRLPPSPPTEKEHPNASGIIDKPKSESKTSPTLSPEKEKQTSPTQWYGYGSEIDSALALLDNCVKDLAVLDVDTTDGLESSIKSTSSKTSSVHTDIDLAIQRAKEVENDLSSSSQTSVQRSSSMNSKQKHSTTNFTHRSSLHESSAAVPGPYVPPRSEVSLSSSMTTHPTPLPAQTSSSSLFNLEMQSGRGVINHTHKPLTRYHSSFVTPTSNTVFVHHIRNK